MEEARFRQWGALPALSPSFFLLLSRAVMHALCANDRVQHELLWSRTGKWSKWSREKGSDAH